jgi:hypothetical protein
MALTGGTPDLLIFARAAFAHTTPGSTVIRIAGRCCQFDCGLKTLAAYSVVEEAGLGEPPGVDWPSRAPDFSAVGWLGGRLRPFSSWLAGDWQWVEFADEIAFCVRGDGSQVHCLRLPTASSLRDEVLLGPVLVLALAARDRYALHASAVAVGNGALLLLGPSGSGKSTLARVAATEGWQRLCDDVTPLGEVAASFQVWPRFPQLKWEPVLQGDDQALPLAGLIWVERGDGPMQIKPMSKTAATKALLRDTVAARLFGAQRLQHHLGFCARLAQRSPCWSLRLPEVAAEQIEITALAFLAELPNMGFGR